MDYFSNRVTNGVQDWISSSTEVWLNQHPIVAWGVDHPLLSLALGLLALFMSWGLLKAIAQVIERVWLLIFQVPFKLSQWIVRSLFNWYKTGSSSGTDSREAEPCDRLTAIVNRLDALKQEQDELLKEAKSMLSSK